MTNTNSLYGKFATKFKIKKKNFYEMHVIIHVLIYLFIIIVYGLASDDDLYYNVYITMVCHANISKIYMDDSCDNNRVYI